MEPIVIIEGDDLAALVDELKSILDDGTSDARPGYLYRLRFAVDDGIKIKANEGAWTLNFGRVEVPTDPEYRIMLDGVEVGRCHRAGEAPYMFWSRVRMITPLTLPPNAQARAVTAVGQPDLMDLAPAFKLERI